MGFKQFTQLAIAGLVLGTAFAQDLPDNAPIPPSEDPPGRAARLSYFTGTVSFQPGGVDDWVPATPNRPLTTGDRLWTETGARAELQTGSAALRLNARTNFTFLNLNDATTQIQISSGTLGIRLRRLDQNEVFEIDTPHAAFTLLQPGEYRVDVNEQGDSTLLTVRGGQAEAATTDNRIVPLGPRTQARILGTADSAPIIDTRDAPVADAFDNFCMDRDRREDRSESARHISREVPGYADLDDHGVWREDAQYGWIWAPRVDPGWAPYHYGHWAWIAPWGWTWVDDAPWGFAPFHYGRWANVGAVWVWVPGPIAVRPVYAPALVAWVGGPRFNVSISIGGGGAVGWFPLGPGEVWVPAYRSSPRYFDRVNVSNTVVRNNVNITNVYNSVYVNKTNVTNVTYVNQRVSGAVTAVPQNEMVRGRPVSQVAVRVPQSAVESGQVQRIAPVTPQREALFGGRQSGASAPPAVLNNRTVMARTTPPAAPVPFERQQQRLQENPGQPLNRTTLRTIQPTGQVSQRAQIRQLNAPPPVGTTQQQSGTGTRPVTERPAVRNTERPVNVPPVTRSTETVAPRNVAPVREAQPQSQTKGPVSPAVTREERINRTPETVAPPPRNVAPVREVQPQSQTRSQVPAAGNREQKGKERPQEKREEKKENK